MSIGPVNLQNLQANNEGVKTTTCSEQIEKAATETLLPVDKVKVRNWFRNDRATLAIVVSYDRPEDNSTSKFDRRSREEKVISCCVL